MFQVIKIAAVAWKTSVFFKGVLRTFAKTHRKITVLESLF